MSYQNLNELVEEIKAQLGRLENQELSIADIDAIQENAKELYERLTVLKYTALEKLVKPEVMEEISQPENAPEPEPKKQQEEDNSAEPAPIRFNIKPITEEIPENQTNLLDEINERITASGDEKPETTKTEEKVANEESAGESHPESEVHSQISQSDDSGSLNDKLGSTEEPVSLADKLKKQPISDLNSAIGINQKFLFMNDLFEGERDAFHESINQLNSFDTYLDADNYIQNNLVNKYNWDLESSSAVRFMELVERRYLS